MKISIQKEKLPITKERQLKLEKINSEKIEIPIKFNWQITREDENETLNDFHLFCISIVRDIVGNKFFTNEKGKIEYQSLQNFDTEEILEDLQYIFSAVADEGIKKETEES